MPVEPEVFQRRVIPVNIFALYRVGEEVYRHAHTCKNMDSVGPGCDEVARRWQGIILEDVAASASEPFAGLNVEKNSAECQRPCKAYDNSVPISCSSRREGHYGGQAAGQQDECHRKAVPDFEYRSRDWPRWSRGSYEEIRTDQDAKEDDFC